MKVSRDNVQFYKGARTGEKIEISRCENSQTVSTRSPFGATKNLLIWIGAATAVVSATAFIQEPIIENGFQTSRARAEPGRVKRESNPSTPDATLVYAAGLNAAPGAIVCRDYEAVMLVFRLYTAHWTDRLQDNLTKGQSRLIRGSGAEEPEASVYGCIVVQPGTAMMLEPGNIVPVVTVQDEAGKFFKGVTMAPMIRK